MSLFDIQINGKAGFIDSEGNVVIEPVWGQLLHVVTITFQVTVLMTLNSNVSKQFGSMFVVILH